MPASRSDFETDGLAQVWAVHHLQIIGEAARLLDERTRAEMPQIAWSQWVGFRHILVHQYFEIDADVVWRLVSEELPEMERTVRSYLS